MRQRAHVVEIRFARHHQDGAPCFSRSVRAMSLCGVAPILFRITNQPIQPRPVAAFTFSSEMEGFQPACAFDAMP